MESIEKGPQIQLNKTTRKLSDYGKSICVRTMEARNQRGNVAMLTTETLREPWKRWQNGGIVVAREAVRGPKSLEKTMEALKGPWNR